jgi:hypothetical protein
MAAVTAPSGGSLIGRIPLAPLSRFLSRLARPARPALANLASVPLHAAGLACVDVGVFTASPVAGWIITGLSLIWLEHVIADEP